MERKRIAHTILVYVTGAYGYAILLFLSAVALYAAYIVATVWWSWGVSLWKYMAG